MTATKPNPEKKTKRKLFSTFNNKVIPIMVFVLLLLFIINAKSASAAVMKSMKLCAISVIPSLFPCMVLSGLLTAVGGGELLGKVFGRPVGFIFGVSPAAVCSLMLGAVCGFPVGAVTAVSQYRRGELTKDELERLLGVACLPSPAFVINVVGASMLGNRMAGIFLYLLLLASSAVVGIGYGIEARCRKGFVVKLSQMPTTTKSEGISKAVVSSVISSLSAILRVCAYVIFFSSMTAVITSLLAMCDVPKISEVLINCIFEFSGGCHIASSSGGRLALPLCALALGWSGIGVHFQVMSVCDNGISFGKYYLSVVLRGVICFITALVVNPVFFDI